MAAVDVDPNGRMRQTPSELWDFAPVCRHHPTAALASSECLASANSLSSAVAVVCSRSRSL